MYCPECGKKNEENASFCEFCGVRFGRVNTAKEREKRLRFRVLRFLKGYGFLVAQALLLVGFIFVFFSTGERYYSPDAAAESYFQALAAGDWERVYDAFELPESEFLTYELFVKARGEQEALAYTSYEITTYETAEDQVVMQVFYQEEGGIENVLEIPLRRTGEKKFLFFDQWTLQPDGYLAEHVNLYLPAGAKAHIDGIELGQDYVQQEDESYINYTIPCVFAGEHLLELEQEYCEAYQEIIPVLAMEDFQYYGEELEIDTALLEEVFQKACQDLMSLYQLGMNRESFKKAEYLFQTDEEVRTAMKKKYNKFAAKICDEDGYGIKEVSFEGLTGTVGVEVQGDTLRVKVALEGAGSYTKAVKDEDGQIKEHSKKADYTTNFVYSGTPGNWFVEEFAFDLIK